MVLGLIIGASQIRLARIESDVQSKPLHRILSIPRSRIAIRAGGRKPCLRELDRAGNPRVRNTNQMHQHAKQPGAVGDRNSKEPQHGV